MTDVKRYETMSARCLALLLFPSLSFAQVTPTLGICGPTGPQETIVLSASLPGYPVVFSETQTLALLTEVNARWQQWSGGRTWVSDLTVMPTVALDSDYGMSDGVQCTMSQLMPDIVARLDAEVDWNRYSRAILIVPPMSGCAWSGSSHGMGCDSAPVYHTDDGDVRMTVVRIKDRSLSLHSLLHEGGHALGMPHAKSARYSTGVIGDFTDRGTVTEYGDCWSSMGGCGNTNPYSAPHLADPLGWTTEGIDYLTVTTPGTWTLQPWGGTGLRALRVQRGSEWVWVQYQGGALLHREAVTLYGGHASVLLDATPATSSWDDAPLKAGYSLRDPYSPLRVTADAVGAALTVTVRYGTEPPPDPVVVEPPKPPKPCRGRKCK